MVLALVLAVSSGQVIYEWTDAKGESHFTDDVSTIPAKAKRRVTQGVEPVVSVPASDAGLKVVPRPAPTTPRGPDSCELAAQKIRALEQQQEREALAFTQQQAREDERCQARLNVSGRGAFAQCMASRTQSALLSTAPAQLEEAREALRRAQVGGCR